MKICRFKKGNASIRLGVVTEDGGVLDLTTAGVGTLEQLLEQGDPASAVKQAMGAAPTKFPLTEVSLCAPVENQEVWAAGVTYLRSKTARMEESDFSASAYDRVYAAERPELFFKSLAAKVSGPGEPIGIRRDSRWSVPEPELALVMNSRGEIVGYTIGNDMSSRDIEGENALYLPQAKVYRHSCALGPWIYLGGAEEEARRWRIGVEILRGEQRVFAGETSVGKIKRSFGELRDFLFRSQVFPCGAVLLTGTGVVPPDEFSLREKDVVRIEIEGIGRLQNTVEEV
jgi:2-dehydro-3-deoxy-D-arabinonate dehydratase